MKQGVFYRLVANQSIETTQAFEDVWCRKRQEMDWKKGDSQKYLLQQSQMSAWKLLQTFNNETNGRAGRRRKPSRVGTKLDIGVRSLEGRLPSMLSKGCGLAGEEKVIFINGNPRAAQAIQRTCAKRSYKERILWKARC